MNSQSSSEKRDIHQVSSERKIKTLVSTYGTVGVLRLLNLHFVELFQKTQEPFHKETAALLREFESIIVRRTKLKIPQENCEELFERTRQALKRLNIEWNE